MRSLRKSPDRLTVVFAASVALAAILVAANQISAWGASEPQARRTASSAAPAAASTFAGVPQHGRVLGSPSAPLTLVEYADLQCPYCAQWTRDTLPTVVDDYVRTGKLRIVFDGLAFIGPDSAAALRTAIAAGRHDRLWDLVDALYANQGVENSGWVTDGLVSGLAGGIPGLGAASLLRDRWRPAVDTQMRRASAAAEAAHVDHTPFFQLGPTRGRLHTVDITSLEPAGIVPAIEAALNR